MEYFVQIAIANVRTNFFVLTVLASSRTKFATVKEIVLTEATNRVQPGVNFINILLKRFSYKIFAPKITKLKCF
jgi:hypothetical protein